MDNSLIFTHIIFFLVGIFQDVFITYYYQTISKEYAWRAAFTSSAVTLINLVILYEILSNIETQVITIILAYAIGNGVGTFMVVRKDKIRQIFIKQKAPRIDLHKNP